MSTITMNMSQGNIERDKPATEEYADEIMCSGWHPAVALSQLTPATERGAFPAELANADLDVFLRKMYG